MAGISQAVVWGLGMEQPDVLARSLLDGEKPVDSGALEKIDVALRRGSTEPVLHAAALWLAFSTGAHLRLGRSNVRGWVPGLHELIDRGHLDAAAYAVPRLTAAWPQVPYLDYMAFVFRHLPRAVDNGREPFVDDPSSDVQIVRTPGADAVVIAFCGARHHLGISLNLSDRWFAQLASHVIYLRDWQKVGFTGGVATLGRDLETTVAALTELVSDLGARRVLCLGNSAGGSGALRYASALGAKRVLALAPMTGGRKYARLVAPHVPPDGATPWGDLKPLYRNGNGVRAHIMYGEKNAGDRQQCVRMAGLPGVTVEALATWESHHLIAGLIRAGRLERVLHWLMSGKKVANRT